VGLSGKLGKKLSQQGAVNVAKSAKKVEQKDADHLAWLVRCRSQNQHTSLVLYQLMSENLEKLREDHNLATLGVSLVAVSFNLWRAVFLVDVDDGRADRVDHAVSFLKTLIADNTIAYTQDKNARGWACLSYINNASFRLSALAKDSPEILPNFERFTTVTVKELWEHMQTNTDLAVGNYANALKLSPHSY
jgi:hypothetical protein